jgi:5-methylcytosine-specific restriction endonuclease McrA
MPPPEKRCTHCGETKPFDEFGMHPTTRDGRQSWCKVCTREAARKIREARPEHCRAQVEDWRKRNPEYMPVYQKARYAANREQMAADERKRRAQRKANGIKVWHSERSLAHRRQRVREYAQRNAEQLLAYHRAYYASGRGHGYQHARKARIQGNGGRYARSEWAALCEKYGQKCLACGETRPLSVDHIVPLSRGGPNTIDNIQPLCKPCNSRKHQRTIDYRTEAAAWQSTG